ncbi:GNAT family N-acetyltransferase [Christiangramia flava]|uniref:GCN5-related N-acetyltransferase n=1 Tax=Christiangramia flava JLT2011 TaxID=1229726 RepID=A0A1L7I4U1_9FLAO|nr:GNAT family N-acetyltransferase [Christiangramia flava]APU68112.1 GCN5-related N-acetyltransferase [Christiangramia flava JLT2011]OSS37628.1 GCN5-related N-acetyltransferase [Christiangramia flava JLT2011]
MEQLQIEVKTFDQLHIEELYDLLQLRSEVFVVEQDCVYQDIDGKDREALHILGKKAGNIVAYTRCFKPGYYFEEAAIGRVVVKQSERRFGYGHEIMKASEKAIREQYHAENIRLSAQQYLTRFYESHGYQQEGEGYLEDGIPHISMVKG